MSRSLRFIYKFPTWRAILMAVVAIAIPVIAAYTAVTNQKALRIGGVLTLSPQATSVFFWALAALTAVAALVAVTVAIRIGRRRIYVELHAKEAVLPKASLSATLHTIPYTAISRMRVVQVSSQQMLVIESNLGESRLLDSAFATPSEFASFIQDLGERIRSAGGKESK